MQNSFLVTSVLFTPLVGLIPLLFLTRGREERIKWIALAVSIIALGAAVILLFSFDPAKAELQQVHYQPWFSFGEREATSADVARAQTACSTPVVLGQTIPAFAINYCVGVDGQSIWLVLLTAFIMPLAILFSLYHVKERVRLYYSFLLLLEFAMLGVFVAQDLFTFYIFWEVSLVPMYFLVGIWGSEQRIYAAVKFFLYTMAGSILMLLAILWLGTNLGTFSVPEITRMVIAAAATNTSIYPAYWVEALLFLGFFIAFAIKVPLWPFHSWLPDAHVQAPTAGSVILAGVLLKLGTYGLVRFCLAFFPQASVNAAPVIALLAVIGIIYGAWVSYAQTDVKKLVAYSSISHLGFVVLGIFALNAAGINGATLQMVNHGISTGGLFLMVGMLYERRHTKAIDAFGGLWKAMPVFSGLALIITLSSMGLPGLNGFVGEFSILLGSFGSTVPGLGPIITFFATTGVILAAVYLLYMWNKVFMGEFKLPVADSHGLEEGQGGGGDSHGHDEEHGNGHGENPYTPLRWNEITALVACVIAAIVIGIYSTPFFHYMDATNGEIAAQAQRYIPNNAPQTAQAEQK